MARAFDPYLRWLSIPSRDQPPHYYRLLGIPLFEEDVAVIAAGADRQMTILRQYQSGVHGEAAADLLNQVARARLCLLKPETKSQYDSRLKFELDAPPEVDATRDADRIAAPLVANEKPTWQRPLVWAGVTTVALTLCALAYLLIGNSPAPDRVGPTVADEARSEPTTDVRLREADRAPELAANAQSERPRPEPNSPASVPGPQSIQKKMEVTVLPSAAPTPLPARDLVSEIDLARDLIEGEWRTEHGKLVSGTGRRERIQIPGSVPPAYTLTVVADRVGDHVRGLSAYLPMGPHSVTAVIDGWNGETSGLEMLHGTEGDLNETRMLGQFTQRGGNTLVYHVQPDRIVVEVNGRQVLQWSGDPAAFAKDQRATWPRPNEVGLTSCESVWKISRLTLTPDIIAPIDSDGVVKPAAPSREFSIPHIAERNNLISAIDPIRDAVQGTWTIESKVLLAPGGSRDRLRLPVKVPGTYTLTLVAERLQAEGYGLSIILPIGKGQAMACIDGWNGRTSGLEAINGVQGHENETTTFSRMTKIGLNAYVCRVTPDSVRVEVNGRLAIDWKGDSTTLAVHPLYALPQTDQLGITGGWATWKILGIQLEPGDSPAAPVEMAAKNIERPDPLRPEFKLAGKSEARRSVPDAASLAAATKSVRERYSIDFATAEKPDDKLALARTLITEAQQPVTEPATCHALLSESMHLAAEAGDLGVAWDALRVLKSRFELDHLPLLENAAQTAGSVVKLFDAARQLVATHVRIANEAVAISDFRTAETSLLIAANTIKKSIYRDLRNQFAVEKKRIETLENYFRRNRLMAEKLKANPTDPEASLACGRYHCFERHDWATGLPLLAQASNPNLSPLAQRELEWNKVPESLDTSGLTQLGDDWWEVAESELGLPQAQIHEHAVSLYASAMTQAESQERSVLQSKIDRQFGASKILTTSGERDGVDVAPAELNCGTPFTLEFWICTKSKTPQTTLMSKSEDFKSPLLLEVRNGRVELSLQSRGTTTGALSTRDQTAEQTPINDGQWHHIAAVKVGNRVFLFVDGQPEGQLTGVPVINTKVPWNAGGKGGGNLGTAARFCRIRLSRSARYLFPFTPEKQYGQDSDTLLLK